MHILSEINLIKLGDCIDLMKQLPESSIDMIFADPPYNLSLSNKALFRPDSTRVHGVRDTWDQFLNFEEYDQFTLLWLKEARRILKPSGTLWVIGTYHNIFRIGKAIQDLNFWILNDVIWHKVNPMPNFLGTRFTNAHETLIWCCKEQNVKYKFNYKIAKNLNDQEMQMRSDWLIPICRGKERIYDENNKIAHTTQKPEALLKRIILSGTDKDDIILDPFLGSGTTAVVAKLLRRKFIGFEKDEKYIKIAQERIKNTIPIDDILIPEKNSPSVRVKFAFLVENGIISPGQILFDSKKQYQAQVRIDGLLICNDIIDTIHGMASNIANKRVNGWSFWYIENNGIISSINDLREQFCKINSCFT